MARELNQVVHEIIVEDHTASGAQSAVGNLDRFEDATKRGTRGLGLLDDAMTRTGRASVSAGRDIERLAARLDPAERATQEFARAQATLQRGFAQGHVSIERHNQLLALAEQRMRSATTANDNVARSVTGSNNAFSVGITRLAGYAAAFLGVHQVARGIGSLVTASAEFEQVQLRLAGVLRATDNAAGQTMEGLLDFAEQMDIATLTSRNAVLEAAASLATFRSVSGETFTRTIELAQDMSAVFGSDLRSSVTQLGKALEDPITGLTALRRVGVTFSEDQKALIKSLVDTGQAAQAQTEILAVLEQQLGGAGRAEAGGVAGAADNFDRALDRVAIALNEATGATSIWGEILNDAAGRLDMVTLALTDINAQMIIFRNLAEITGIPAFDAIVNQMAAAQALATAMEQIEAMRAELNRPPDTLPAVTDTPPGRDPFGYGMRSAIPTATRAELQEMKRQVDSAIADVEVGLTGAFGASIHAGMQAGLDQLTELRDLINNRLGTGASGSGGTSVAREVAADFDAVLADLAAAGEAQQAAWTAANENLGTYIASLAEEARLAGLSTDERAAYNREMEVAKAIEEARNTLLDDEGALIRDLTDEERRRVEELVRGRQAIEDQQRRYEEMMRVVESVTDDVIGGIGGGIIGALDGAEPEWKQVWTRMRNFAIQALTDLTLRPVVVQLVGAVVGTAPSLFGIQGGGGIGQAGSIATGGGGSSGGGLGGLFNLPTPPLGSLFGGNGGFLGGFLNTPIWGSTNVIPGLGTGALAGNPLGLAPGAFASGAFTIGNALSGIGLGASIGGLLSMLTGGNQLGGSIGGGVGGLAGAAIGSIIPGIGTLLGGAIGGGLGGLIGGLFGGSKPSVGPNAGANIDWSESQGKVIVSGAGADNGGDVAGARSLAQVVADAINLFADELDVSQHPAVGGYQFGSFGGGLVGRLGGNVFTSGDPQKIVEDTIFKMLRSGDFRGLDATTQTVVANSKATNVNDLLADIDFARALTSDLDLSEEKLTGAEQAIKAINDAFDEMRDRAIALGLGEEKLIAARDKAIAQLTTDFERGIELQVLAFTNPLEGALEALADAQEARLREAEVLGANLVEVERLSALEREAVLKQSVGDLRAWLDGQAIGSTATTGVGRLAEAQGQFGAVVEAIRGGTASAENLARVTALADTIIGLAGQLYGGTGQHAFLEQAVRSTIETIGKDLGFPGFAMGGDHRGGWRVVGEFGPELEFTPPSRIYSAGDIGRMMSSDRETRRHEARLMLEQTAEIRGLRDEMAEMRAAYVKLARAQERALNERAGRRAA